MLNDIIECNKQLSKYPDIIPMLHQLENFIPFDSRDNFYTNLIDLKIEKTPGNSYYKVRENVMGIRNNFSYNVTASENEKIQDIRLKQHLFHELMHMSSTRIDRTNGAAHCGFSVSYPINNIFLINNNYLNEGFTELFTELYYPRYNLDYAYFDFTNIASILTILLGMDDIKEAYFTGTSASYLKNRLSSFTNNTNVDILFYNVEASGNKNESKSSSIDDLLRESLFDIIYDGINSFIDKGVFNSYDEGISFFYSSIDPLIRNLISMVKDNTPYKATMRENLIYSYRDYEDKIIKKIKVLKK